MPNSKYDSLNNDPIWVFVYFGAAVALLLVIAALIPGCGEAKPVFDDKLIKVQDIHGTYGAWADRDKFQMGLIVRQTGYGEAVPYVEVFVRDAKGKLPKYPYGLTMQGGELNLQLQETDDRGVVAFPMSHVLKLLEAEMRKPDKPHHWWMAGPPPAPVTSHEPQVAGF